MEPYLGQIQPFGFNFAPRGWALCDGQLLPINQWSALFSLLGTTFGGDGRTTFGLPDLRGRQITHVGQGAGLPNVTMGPEGWQLPECDSDQERTCRHTPTMSRQTPGKATIPIRPTSLSVPIPMTSMRTRRTPRRVLPTTAMAAVKPFNIQDPFLGIYVCIALTGVYPSRN